MKNFLDSLRRYISPVFLLLLAAAFVLWYIAKLNYTYTTEQLVHVEVDGERFEVACVVEGIGTNLFAYSVYMNKILRIPLSELQYIPSREEDGQLIIDPQSLQSAISVRFSDIKVTAIGAIPAIKTPALKP